MSTSRIVQAAAILLGPILIAGCAATNQYVSKLFSPRPEQVKDTLALVKFLELDEPKESDAWIVATLRTDSTLAKDSAAVFAPIIVKQSNSLPATSTTKVEKKAPITKETVAKNTKSIPIPDEPVARTENSDGTRTKKSREQ